MLNVLDGFCERESKYKQITPDDELGGEMT